MKSITLNFDKIFVLDLAEKLKSQNCEFGLRTTIVEETNELQRKEIKPTFDAFTIQEISFFNQVIIV